MKAVIYARISFDRNGEAEGTERQLEDCRALAAARGWQLVGEYVDNDVSAWSGRKRPEFERLLDDLRTGAIDTVIVWRTDRLARRGKDLQRFLDTGSHTLTSCTEPEFTGTTGLVMLRILSAFAEHESGVKSERVARKMLDKRRDGDPHSGGVRCFGYSGTGRELEQAEAAHLRDAARRILAGETASDVVADWTSKGVPTVKGGQWKATNLWKLLRSPRLAGLVEINGQLQKGTFPAVLDRKTWDRLRAYPTRRASAPRRALLSGLLVCGRCGAGMVGSGEKFYMCRAEHAGGCAKVTITKKVEDYVVRTVLARLDGPMLQSLQRSQSQGDHSDSALAALHDLENDLAQLEKDYRIEKIVARPLYLESQAELQGRIDGIRRELAQAKNIIHTLDHTVVTTWEQRTLSSQRAVLAAVVERIQVMPVGRGSRMNPRDRLTIHWRA